MTPLRIKLFHVASRMLVAIIASSGLVSVGLSEEGDSPSAGPLLSRFPLTLDQGERLEALGPLFYRQRRDTETTFALPPLFSHVWDDEGDSEEYDFAYPLLSYDRFGKEYRWHFFQLLSFAGGQRQDEVPARRFTIFPIYFQQRSPDAKLNYTALVPFYGHLKGRLFKDEIFFAGFPFYAQTRKRDVVTDNYLFPFGHVRRGNSLSGWGAWPFAGREHKDITSKTNGFGDVETIPGHESFYAAWPFYITATTGIGTENPQTQFASLPFYASTRSPNRDSTTVLWPFFTWTDDRERKYREWDFPWPLMVIARGEGKTTTRFFPFFSQAHSTNLQSDFYLWPVYKYNRLHNETVDRDRTRILLFLFDRVNEKNLETGKSRQRTACWPLFTHRRDRDGSDRLQILAPLEPLLPQSKSIERNYSPLWSVWRAERNVETGRASQSLLWNLWRRETTATTKKNSLLFGLFQYQSDTESKRWRLFYLPPVTSPKESSHVPKHR